MAVHVGLLRAINVGGTGKLAMSDLVALCERAGLSCAATYIQSGNVVFRSELDEPAIVAGLAAAVSKKVGKPIGVVVRSAAEIAKVAGRNPFPDAPPARVIVSFLPTAPPVGAVDGWKAPGGEQLVLAGREIFIYFPSGQGASRMKMPFADVATARNLNTVRRLAAMAAALTEAGPAPRRTTKQRRRPSASTARAVPLRKKA